MSVCPRNCFGASRAFAREIWWVVGLAGLSDSLAGGGSVRTGLELVG